MTREETASALKILKVSYPSFYSRFNREDMLAVLDLWSDMFRGDDIGIVKIALYRLLETHQGYPPSIAELKAKVREVESIATGEPTDEELWRVLRKAISNGYYGAREEYEKLPSVLQRYLGSPAALRELSQGDAKTIDTVTHGQFLKQIGSIRERQEFTDSLPESMRLSLRSYAERGEALSEADVNARRNNVLDALEG